MGQERGHSDAGAPGGKRVTTSFDAFISYSHVADAELARSLQAGLHRFAKPWYKLRSLRVFRDESSLSANPALWPSITEALDSATWFVLLASPEAARSEWVGRELEYWCSNRRKDRLLIVVTGGVIAWDQSAADFDWAITDSLPAGLRGILDQEPRFVDLTWASGSPNLTLRNSRFAEAVADIAATLHDRPKDELIGDDVRQYRRTRRVAGSAIVSLMILLIAAVFGGLVAVDQRRTALAERDRAEEQARIALSRQLAAEASTTPDDRFDLALLLAAQAYDVEPTTQATGALLTVLARSPRLLGYLSGISLPTSMVLDPSQSRLVVGTEEGNVSVWDTVTMGRVNDFDLSPTGSVAAAAFSQDGQLVAAGNRSGALGVWNVRSGEQLAHTRTGSPVLAIAFEESGSAYAASDDQGNITIWDVGVTEPRFVLDSDNVTGFDTLAFDGDSLVAGTRQREVTTWLVDGEPILLHTEVVGGGMPLASAYNSDMSQFAGVTLGLRSPYLYDIDRDTFSTDPVLEGPTIDIDSLSFSADERTLAGSGEGRVVLWDTQTQTALGEELRGVPGGVGETGSDSEISSRSFRGPVAVGGSVVAAGDWRGVAVFDLSSHTLLRRIEIPGSTPIQDVPNVVRGAASAAFSPDGRLLALTSYDPDSLGLHVKVWDIEGEQELLKVPATQAAGFSPDGGMLAVESDEGFTLVDMTSGSFEDSASIPWEQGSAEPEATVPATPWVVEHEGLGASVAFDGTVTLWDTERGQSIGILEVPGAFDSSALVFDPQGRSLAVASTGGEVSLIDTDIESWHRRACQLAGRSLTDEEWNTYIGSGANLQRSCGE